LTRIHPDGNTRLEVPTTANTPSHRPPARPRRLFLTGMMGCGKSAVGSHLAPLLGWPHLDNDQLLALREGLDLMGLAHEGADRLHDAEARLVRVLAERPPPFIAGIPASVADHDTEGALLAAAGLVVYLRARAETLVARTLGGGRPFLAEDPLGWTTATLGRRAGAFEHPADLILDVDNAAPVDLAVSIADFVRRSGGDPDTAT
jgi:shikimate kinase